jgi:hypothetical protein
MEGITKLFLVDENTLKSASIPIPTTMENQQTGEGGGISGLSTGKEVQNSPFTSAEEREVFRLKKDIDNIIGSKLPVPDRLLNLLTAIKSFVRLRNKMEEEEKAPMQVEYRGDDSSPVDVEYDPAFHVAPNSMSSTHMVQKTPAIGLSSSRRVDPMRQDVTFNPATLEMFGKRKNMFSEPNMLRSLQSRIKPKFNAILNQLKTKSTFDWDKATGEMTVNNEHLSGSNIKELILHKIRLDMKELTHDPPTRFHKFNLYLKRHNITSNRVFRYKRPSVKPSPTPRQHTLPRDKNETIQLQKKITVAADDDDEYEDATLTPAKKKKNRSKSTSSAISGQGLLNY